MCREFVAMGMGMGVMPGRKHGFCLRVVGCMRSIRRVVLFSLSVALLVLPG